MEVLDSLSTGDMYEYITDALENEGLLKAIFEITATYDSSKSDRANLMEDLMIEIIHTAQEDDGFRELTTEPVKGDADVYSENGVKREDFV